MRLAGVRLGIGWLAVVSAMGCDAGNKPRDAAVPVPIAPAADDGAHDSAEENGLFVAENGFSLLALGDFESFSKEPGGDSPWSGEGATIRCAGKPRGYLYSKKSYRNFALRLEYRFMPSREERDSKKLAASNTGVLVYITGEHKVWPASLEVQGKHVEMASIKSNGGAATVEIDDDVAAREKARKPVGEWNSLEIVSRDGSLTSSLNGTQICTSVAGELREGPIGLQAEDFSVEFRNVRVREE